MYYVRCAVALERGDLFGFVILVGHFFVELQVISFRGEALRFRPRPSRLARNNYEHAYMRCEHSHWAQNAMGMRVAFTPHFRERGSCLFGPGLAAPSSRGVCALWRARGRVARTGGRAGRAGWPLVSGCWWESGSDMRWELVSG